MSKLRGSDADLGAIFGIDIDSRKPSAITQLAAKVSRWNPKTTLAVIAGTATGGILLGFLAGRKSTSVAPPSVTVPVTITPAHDAPASPATLPAAIGGHLTVTTRNKIPGQLRAAAGLDAARLSTVAAGTIVQVLDSKDGTDGKRWYHVQTPAGQTGWMHGEILS